MRFAVVVVCCFLCNCEKPPEAAGCEPACEVREPACAGCPAIADELCVGSACEARGDDVVDLAIDVSLDRNLDGVTALTVAVVDARVSSCADVGPVKDAVNVLAGNRFNVSGGSFHEDLRVGLVPAGAVVVAVDALDDAGEILESGCAAFEADDTALEQGVLVEVP
ncbi:MAG: hypothetical protein Q8O67_15380 [Deltaproteobacteria bacterium]|nr:hypothetical protein [Deltaproteobacteria bacterium]